MPYSVDNGVKKELLTNSLAQSNLGGFEQNCFKFVKLLF